MLSSLPTPSKLKVGEHDYLPSTLSLLPARLHITCMFSFPLYHPLQPPPLSYMRSPPSIFNNWKCSGGPHRCQTAINIAWSPFWCSHLQAITPDSHRMSPFNREGIAAPSNTMHDHRPSSPTPCTHRHNMHFLLGTFPTPIIGDIVFVTHFDSGSVAQLLAHLFVYCCLGCCSLNPDSVKKNFPFTCRKKGIPDIQCM